MDNSVEMPRLAHAEEMPTRPRALPRHLTHAAFRTADAHRAGVDPQRLRRHDLARPFHGIYHLAKTDDSLLSRCRAFRLKMLPNWVFTGPTAARLLRIPLPRPWNPAERIHVLALGGINAPKGAGVEGTRTALPLRHGTCRGLPVLAPAETWATLAPLLELDDLIAAGDRIVGLPTPLGTEEQLQSVARLFAGRRGTQKMRAALELISPGSRSPRETRLRLMLQRAGLPTGRLNGKVTLPNGRHYYGDLVVDDYKVIFEYDGDQHRTDDRQWDHDVRRLNELAAGKWLVVRFTKHQREHEVIAVARSALVSRGWNMQ